MVWLDPIPEPLRARALDALGAGDALRFLCTADSKRGLELVRKNFSVLKERGLYEAALLSAFAHAPTGAYPVSALRVFFQLADRARLRALAPLPSAGPFTLYRGVAGCGRARRIRGMSWTGSYERAKWFADRRGADYAPAVYCLQAVSADDVHAYTNERQEDEYVVTVRASHQPVRVEGPQRSNDRR